MNLSELILRRARMQPHVPAIIERKETITSYRDLANRVTRTAAHLAAFGVARGDQVGLCLKDDSSHIIAFLAVARLGAIAVQIDWRSRPAEKERIVGEFPLRLALVAPDSDKGVNCPKVALDADWDAAVAAANPALDVAEDWSDPMAALASSGTTGLPKFTLATHLQYHFHMMSYLEMIPPKRHRYLSIMPLYFSAGRVACLSHLLRGDTLVFHPVVSSAEELAATVSRHNVTVAFGVPSVIRQFLSVANDGQPLLPDVELLISGGAPLFPEEKLAVASKVTPRFCEVYGTAAMGPMASLRADELQDRPTSVGRPFSFVDLEIADQDDQPLEPGTVGQLRCRGPGLTFPMESSSQSISNDFRGGWYYPGELATVDELGYIFLQGRTSEVIFRGGAKVFPGEIEATLLAHDSVADAAVVGRVLPNNEQEPVAYVIAKHPVTPGDLLAFCRTRLIAFKIPREIHIVAQLPRNSSGKVDKRALLKTIEQTDTLRPAPSPQPNRLV